jgi:hypothetical protein
MALAPLAPSISAKYAEKSKLLPWLPAQIRDTYAHHRQRHAQ